MWYYIWKIGKKDIDINERIKDIEEENYINIETISNSKESLKIFQWVYNSIESEILIISNQYLTKKYEYILEYAI